MIQQKVLHFYSAQKAWISKKIERNSINEWQIIEKQQYDQVSVLLFVTSIKTFEAFNIENEIIQFSFSDDSVSDNWDMLC